MTGDEKILSFCKILKFMTAAGNLMYNLQQEYIYIGWCILVLELKVNVKTCTIKRKAKLV